MTLKEILENIGNRHGVEKLNPMQQAVAGAKADRLLLLAPTGSGKTLAFAVPLVSRLGSPAGKVQALILAPARELVIQIAEVIRPIANGHGYKTVALYGGHSMAEETNSLSVTPDIVVATPGRLIDHINRGSIQLGDVRQLVIDEYDKALELGFTDQMRRIVKRLRSLRYATLTSATPLAQLPDFIDMSQAKTIDYSAKTAAPRSRMQISRVVSQSKDKLEALAALLRSLPNGKTIVFVNHRESAERVYNFLHANKFPVGLYHGGLDQLQREIAIDQLNNGATPILVSTDLGSRGLDIDNVRQVVHYHLPPSPEAWTHRNGRTARVDASGNVFVLVSEGEALPAYIDVDGDYTPAGTNPDPIASDVTTLYINAGKKEKVSKTDVLGFLTKQAGLTSAQVGKIVVKDHASLAAVPTSAISQVMAVPSKIKGQRVKITTL